MQPPTSNPPTKLKIRTYACRASARRIKEGLERLVETSLAFNESWLLGEFDECSRIGGKVDRVLRGTLPRKRPVGVGLQHTGYGISSAVQDVEDLFVGTRCVDRHGCSALVAHERRAERLRCTAEVAAAGTAERDEGDQCREIREHLHER